MDHFFYENCILPLTHDEVVYERNYYNKMLDGHDNKFVLVRT